SGAKMIWRQKFDRADVIALLPRATAFMGVPTFYTRLLAGDDFNAALVRHMRLFTSGSAPLLAETFEEFRSAEGHVMLVRDGKTAAGLITSTSDDCERRAGTVGFPLTDFELGATDEAGSPRASGEIGGLGVFGPNDAAGY